MKNNINFKNTINYSIEDAINQHSLILYLESLKDKRIAINKTSNTYKNPYIFYVDILKNDINNDKNLLTKKFKGYEIEMGYKDSGFVVIDYKYLDFEKIKISMDFKDYIEDKYNKDFYTKIGDFYTFSNLVYKLYFHKYKENKEKHNFENYLNKKRDIKHLDKLIDFFINESINKSKAVKSNKKEPSYIKNDLIRRFNFYIAFKEYVQNKEGEFMNFKENLIEKIKSKGEIPLENDEEILFSLGQVLRKMQIFIKKDNKSLEFIEPFMLEKKPEQLKNKFQYFLKQYTHLIDTKFNNYENTLISQILIYDFKKKVDSKYIIAGFLDKNHLFYEKESEEK